MNVKELKEARARLIHDMREIVTAARKDGRQVLNAEEEKKWNLMDTEVEAFGKQIIRETELEKRELELGQPEPRKASPQSGEHAEADKKELRRKSDEVFEAWVRGGDRSLTAEQLKFKREQAERLLAGASPELRALSVGTDTAGGFTVGDDTSFIDQIDVALKEFGGMRRARSTIINTGTGADLPIPTTNDTAQTGELLAENAAAAEQDVVFGQVVLQSFMYSSKMVKVSIQLLQDGAIDVVGLLARLLGTRIGRITNTHFTTGDGSGKPNGVVTASNQGVVGTTGQTTSIIQADLVDLFHSLDEAYRENAQWMLADSSLKIIKKIEDADGRLLWTPGLSATDPATILGKPFIVNNDVPVMAANAKSVLFGDFSKYWIRDVRGMTLLQLRERFAENLQVAFLAFSRHDGDLIDAGTKPIKHYANSAT